MAGKFERKKNRTGPVVLAAGLILAAAAVLAVKLAPEQPQADPAQTTAPVQTIPTQTAAPETVPARTEPVLSLPINLGEGLTITDVGSYTGAYMEDGTDELVSDVLMILVENNSGWDFQLADVELTWNGESCTFRLTNLPAGGRVVLLEQSRKACPDGAPTAAALTNPVNFREPMSVQAESFEITGLDQMLNVRNISGADITGDIYVYYKYASDDLFYGGITFRVPIEGGLKDGELRQIPAGHFTPGRCTIVQVTVN